MELANRFSVLNPFLYRGYYYIKELGLYYLKTRFYDPSIGRFISADSLDYLDPHTVGGMNLFAYCNNNPVMNVDPSGHAWWNWVLSGLAIAGGVALCFVPGAQAVGIALIAGGATSLAPTVATALGADGKTVSIVSNIADIVVGSILLATPAAGVGASMIGSGALGLAGGAISETLGGSYELGSAIGNIAGGLVGGGIYKGLVNHGVVPFKVRADKVLTNPSDPFCNPSIGPKQGEIVKKNTKHSANRKIRCD